jgi:hypothetical protein
MKKNLKEIIAQIITQITAHFADKSVNVKIFDENDREITAPAILFDIEEISEGNDRGEEMTPLDCVCSAYCVLAANTPDLQAAIRDFAAAMLTLARQNNWQLINQATMPEALRAVPAEFAPKNPQIESWVVEWNQTFYLGESIWDDEGVVPTVVNIGYDDGEYTELIS